MRSLSIVAVLVCAAGSHADESSEARQHYSKAQGHFAVGEFGKAADEYEAAFKLKQDAALLFNAAQSRRLSGDNEKALVLYKNYLQFYPRSKNIADVREQISKLQDAIAAAQSAKTAPPINTVEMGKQGENAAVDKKDEKRDEVADKKPVDQPIYKKWWLWTIVGVAVVGIGLGVGLGLALNQPAWNDVPNVGPGAKALSIAPARGLQLEVRW